MSASVFIGTVALIGSLALSVTIAVLVSRALSNAFLTVNQMHERFARHQDKLIDRIVTTNWENYAALQSLEYEQEAGGFFTPEEQRDQEPDDQPLGLDHPKYGTLSTLKDRLDAVTAHEEQLLAEDFSENR